MAKRLPVGFYWRGRKIWCRTDPVTKRERSTGCADIDAAILWRARREREAADPALAAQEQALLGDWIERYLEHRDPLTAPSTRRYNREKLEHWLNIFSPSCSLSKLTPLAFDVYLMTRRAKKVLDQTIGKEIAVMQRVLRHAKRAGAYAGDLSLLRPAGLPGCARRSRWLTRRELNALLAECSPRIGAAVALAVACGARRSELLRMTPEHIGDRSIAIPGTKTSRSASLVPIVSIYRPMVEMALEHLPLGAINLNRELALAAERAGLERVTPNDLRRTHITILREAGIDRESAKQMLRHSPSSNLIDTVYDQSRPEQLAHSIERSIRGVAPLRMVVTQ